MKELKKLLLSKGAKIYANLSGGKDGHAMLKHLVSEQMPVEAVIHCDLGRVEWPQSMDMCKRSANEFSLPFHVIYRTDKMDMIDLWNRRLIQLKGTGKPFWSSKSQRYCTSDMKRDPTDRFYRNCGHNFIISAEGIRADESNDRAKKNPFEIRRRATSSYYDGMGVYEAIEKYHPDHRLAITWYPIFDWSIEDVYMSYGVSMADLFSARVHYKKTGEIISGWPFHPAYAMGNDRVSCMFCIMGSMNDLSNAAIQNPGLLDEMIRMEEEGNATFKNKFSLKQLKHAKD